MGYVIPGKLTIPDQIAEDRTPYYKALEAVDTSLRGGKLNLSPMEELVSSMLARQLFAVCGDSQS